MSRQQVIDLLLNGARTACIALIESTRYTLREGSLPGKGDWLISKGNDAWHGRMVSRRGGAGYKSDLRIEDPALRVDLKTASELGPKDHLVYSPTQYTAGQEKLARSPKRDPKGSFLRRQHLCERAARIVEKKRRNGRPTERLATADDGNERRFHNVRGHGPVAREEVEIRKPVESHPCAGFVQSKGEEADDASASRCAGSLA